MDRGGTAAARHGTTRGERHVALEAERVGLDPSRRCRKGFDRPSSMTRQGATAVACASVAERHPTRGRGTAPRPRSEAEASDRRYRGERLQGLSRKSAPQWNWGLTLGVTLRFKRFLTCVTTPASPIMGKSGVYRQALQSLPRVHPWRVPAFSSHMKGAGLRAAGPQLAVALRVAHDHVPLVCSRSAPENRVVQLRDRDLAAERLNETLTLRRRQSGAC